MEKNAEYQLSTAVHEGILEIVITGKMTAQTGEKMHADVVALTRRLNVKALLADVRATTGRLGHIEAFLHVRRFRFDEPGVITAVVDLPENVASESFLETAAVNVGR